MPVSIRECHTAEDGLGLRPLLQGAPPHGEQRPSNGWTKERIERLKSLVAEGLKASQIADQLDLSRSAIIGKVARLGIRLATKAKRGDQRAPYGSKPPPKRPFEKRLRAAIAVAATPEPEMPSPNHLGIAFFDLKPQHCRFPQGEGFGVTYCGHQVQPDSPYCDFHYGLCYMRPERRQRVAA